MQMTSPLASVELHFVDTLDDVLAMYEWAGLERDTPIGIDTESSGLSPERDKLRLIQLGDEKHGWAIPVTWAGAVIDLIRRMLRKKQQFVAHNSGFDNRFLTSGINLTIPWSSLHDTLIIAALADPGRPKGLKPLAARFIDKNATAGEKLLHDAMRANNWTWGTVPVDFPGWWAYGALDPVLTVMLWTKLSPGVLQSCPEAYDLERSVLPLLAGMMTRGLLLDRPYAEAKLEELRSFITDARGWLESYHGVTSLMSARQIASALATAGTEVTGTTATGMPSVTKEVLTGISKDEDATAAARDLAATILKARHAEKMASAYIENFLEIAAADGAIHPSINQLAARSSRMSISDPSLQNLPTDDVIVRGCIIPRPGKVLISCDYSAIEMRLAASLSGDPGLIQAFYDSDHGGQDLYITIASDLFGRPVVKSSKERQLTKNFSYAKLYGSGIRTMARTVGMREAEVKPVYQMFGEKFPGLDRMAAEFYEDMQRQLRAGEEPSVCTDTGRRLIVDKNRLYSATNYKIQGTAAEVLKRGISNMAAAGFADNMLIPIHDEILCEVDKEDAEEACRAIENAMGEMERYAVPLKAEAKILPERWVKS